MDTGRRRHDQGEGRCELSLAIRTKRGRVDDPQALLGTHSLLASPLTCFKCDEPHHNVPKLKSHLEKEFQEEGRKALARIKKTGRQQTSSEEDMF